MDSTTHCGNKLSTNCIVGIWCQLATALWEYYFLKKVIFQHLYPCTSWYKQRQIMLSNINFQLLFLAHPSTIACSQIGYPGPPTMLCNKFTIPPRIKLHSSFLVQKNQGILKGGIGSLFEPCVNAMGQQPYWPVMHGGELLYLRIWHNYSVRSAHIIVIVWFTAW